jgi:O-antigen ligase
MITVFGSTAVLVYTIVKRKMTKSSIIITATVGIIAGLYFVGKVINTENYKFIFNKSLKIYSSVEEGGLHNESSGRGERLISSWDAIITSPLLGHGPQGYKAARNGNFIGGGHSTWLDTIVSYGLVGGIWFFIMLASIGQLIWKNVKEKPGDILSIPLMFAFVSFLIYGIIDTVSLDMVIFYIFYGGAVALYRQQIKKKRISSSTIKTSAEYIPINQFQGYNRIV